MNNSRKETSHTVQPLLEDESYNAEFLYRSAFESLGIGLIVQDTSDKVLMANRSAADILGLSLDQLLGKDSYDPRWRALHEDGTPFRPEEHPSVITLSTDKPVEDVLMNVVSGEEKRSFINITSKPIHNDQGQLIAAVTAFEDVTERVLSEKRLRTSEAELNRAQSIAHLGSWVWHITTNRLDWSDEMYQIFGIEKDRFSGDLAEVMARSIHPDDRLVVEQSNLAVINEKRPVPVEYRVVLSDGTEKTVWAEAGELQTDEEGRPTTLKGVVLDISHRKQIELQLIQKQCQLEEAERIAQTGSWDWNVINDETSWSRGLFLIYGIDPHNGVPSRKDHDAHVHPDDLPELRRAITDSIENKRPYHVEYRLRRYNDGDERWLSATAEIVGSAQGGVERLVGIVRDETKQRIAEQELNETQGRFRSVWESTSDALAISDPEGVLIDANPAYFHLYGYTADQLLGKSFALIFPEDAREGAVAQYKLIFAQENVPESFETEIQRSDGNKRVVESQISFIEDRGRRTAMLSTIRDITEKKRAEEDIKTILRSLPSSIVVLDNDGTIIEVNDAWAELARKNGGPSEAKPYLGWNYLDVCRRAGEEDGAGHALSGLLGVLSGDMHHFEFEYPCTSDEEERWYLMRADLMKSAKRQLLISHLDITSRKRAEVELKTAHQHLALSLEAAQLGVWSWNTGTRRLVVNDRLAKILGIAPHEQFLDFDDWHTMIHPEDKDYYTSRIGSLFDNQSVYGIKYRTLSKNGEIRYLESSAVQVENESDDTHQFIGITQDITEHTLADQELTKSRDELRALAQRLQTVREEESTRIAREIHDELGQNLTALGMDLALVEKHLASDPARASERLDSAISLIQTTTDLIRKISGELRPGALDTVGLSIAMDMLLDQMRKRLGTHCRITADIDELDLPDAVSTGLYRVFQELMTNVVRHAQASVVDIRLHKQGKQALLEVVDNGRGLKPEDIINPNSLGLIGLRERCLAIGANIEFKGDEGQGTAVRVSVPLNS